ncbi:MAG: hypothetical protein IKL03_09075 [Bacteroidaceae bacterium]|nr:hypothetical protein [Bacteroidaceae bacterium]
MIELHYKKNISSTLYRSMIVMLLLCSFALGVKAQEEWILEGTHATEIDNGVVYLNDLEDHNWTYYNGVDGSVDNEYYNNNYEGTLYSPNPRNVMITYQGVNNVDGSTTQVKVSIDEGEDQSTFVYYKTLEPGNNEGEYPYTVISNPFSVRPSVVKNGTKTYYGFNGWKIVSGGEYIKNYDNNQILPLDAEIVFENLPYDIEGYPVNCISANIVFQTTWVRLNNIVRLTTYTTKESYTYTADGGTYETNILVLQTDLTQHIVANSPCTVMMVEPDGSDDYRDNYTFDRLLRPAEGVNNRTKIEYVHWQPSGAINARGRNFTIGRGIVMDGTTRAVYGTSTAGTVEEPLAVNQILKVESGKYLKFENYGATPTEIQKQCVIFGCDYDRANEDNSKLAIAEKMCVAYSTPLPDNLTDNSEICRVYSLSGSFVTEELVGNAEHTSSYYFNVGGSASAKKGYRYLEILGGEWKNIVGGWGPEHPTDQPAFIFRMKGGHILGSIYGAAQYEAAKGTCTFVITGGTINGWIAGGANGTKEDKGDLDGESFIYVGGDAKIDSKESTTRINRAVGGNVFGAGCGYSATSTSGQVTLGTNVVIADNAYVERGVYGGGSYGYCPTDKTANIYITGGTVDGKPGGANGTSYNANIQGGVYGGACQNKGGSVNIFMTGGTVHGGIFGGSNASGEVAGPITLTMTGGTVENIFGGGNEAPVKGNTNVTITGGEVKQNVYGGGNKAAVSGTTNVIIGK